MTKNNRQIPIAILGCDGYGQKILERVLQMPDQFRLTGAVSVTPWMAGSQLCVLRSIPLHDSVQSLFKKEGSKPQVVINATPIPVHVTTTMQCLENGADVWLEKPATAGNSIFASFVRDAKVTGRKVEVCYNSLYQPNIQWLRDRIQEGKYGRLLRIDGVGAFFRTHGYFSRANWAGRIKMNGTAVYDGCLNNTFSHLLSTALFLAASGDSVFSNAKIEAVRMWHLNPIESEDTCSLHLTLPEEVPIRLNMTLCAEEEIQPVLRFSFDQAIIEIRSYQDITIHNRNGKATHRKSDDDLAERTLLQLASAQLNGDTICPLESCAPLVQIVEDCFQHALDINDGRIPKWLGAHQALENGLVISRSYDLFMDAFNKGQLISCKDDKTELQLTGQLDEFEAAVGL